MPSRPPAIEVRKIPLHSVSDASELTKLIDDGVIAADRVIAVIGKTEGNGGVNDYTRIIADRAFREALVAKIVACGLMTPSVPPDQTIGTCLTSSTERLPLATSTSRKARSAMIRV